MYKRRIERQSIENITQCHEIALRTYSTASNGGLMRKDKDGFICSSNIRNKNIGHPT